jgi:uncharacterized DUF497 family protein
LAISFEWDSRKEKANRNKHGVSFAEACTVFDDRLAKIFPDSEHSQHETREILVGHSLTGKLLLVSFTERKPDRVPIINARQATKAEKEDYEEAG